ncbi:MAG: hypothetical protein HOV80_09205 [Polyangiaceae bacterium]|nr:hypothetical protein [Polyangiaceae bacterium]
MDPLLVGVVSLVALAAAGFVLGRRWGSREPFRWAAAAGILQLVLLNVARRLVFDAPPESVGNALYRDGLISYNEAERIAEAADAATLTAAVAAAVATLGILVAAAWWFGTTGESRKAADDRDG